MKRFLLVALFAGITAATSPLLAQDGSDAPAKPKSPIKVEMKKLDKAIDALDEFFAKPDGAPPMNLLADAQASVQAAKQHVPSTAEQQPEDKRAAFIKDYKLQLNQTIRGLLDVEDALLQQDYKAAEKALGDLVALKKPGHRKFKGKRRRGGRGGAAGGGK